MSVPHRRYLLILSLVFVAEWVLLAIHPFDRKDWALENAMVAAFVLLMIVSYRRLILSRISYALIFVFLCLHEVGAHYTVHDGSVRRLVSGIDRLDV